MNTKLSLIVLLALLSGASVVTLIENQLSARAGHDQQIQSARYEPASLDSIRAQAPFRVRELHELPPGYALMSSVFRDSPSGDRNTSSVVLAYRGPDAGLLELTEIPLNLMLDGATSVRLANRDVQYVQHNPPGATTRTYVWRDDDVSLQLNVYIPPSAQSLLTPAAIERIVAATR